MDMARGPRHPTLREAPLTTAFSSPCRAVARGAAKGRLQTLFFGQESGVRSQEEKRRGEDSFRSLIKRTRSGLTQINLENVICRGVNDSYGKQMPLANAKLR
ncbi:MAG: hypothetical protein F6K24_07415 [Okeania sp. SIO2D1]|nr:hypothetical protein [Okeania sp. SIO2D1]